MARGPTLFPGYGSRAVWGDPDKKPAGFPDGVPFVPPKAKDQNGK